MINEIDNSPIDWDDVLNRLPANLIAAAELCAIPNLLDVPLAETLLREVGNLNGTTVRTLGEIESLPFVAHIGGQLHLSRAVRGALVERLERRREAFIDANRLTSTVYAERYHRLPDKSHSVARRLQWNLAFHLTPVDSKRAVAELDDIVTRASTIKVLADTRAVVELTSERRRWLTDHSIDICYYEGRLAYEEQRYEDAEPKLLIVWNKSPDAMKQVVSGHFLGRMWAAPHLGYRWTEADAILTEAAALAHKRRDILGEAMILTTLGSLLSRRRGRDDDARAIAALRDSIRLSEVVGDPRGEGFSRTTLASVLTRSKDPEAAAEAEWHLRTVLRLMEEGKTTVDGRVKLALGRLLAERGSSERTEALSLIREGVEKARRAADSMDLAIHLEALGNILLRDRETAAEGRAALTESLELGRAVGDMRHQAIVAGRLSRELSGEGRLARAIELQEEVVRLNLARGDRTQAERSQRRLEYLRDRSTGEPGLEPG